jgi:hypothetical protein
MNRRVSLTVGLQELVREIRRFNNPETPTDPTATKQKERKKKKVLGVDCLIL